MITSKEVFAKRKEGALDEAYEMATELINGSERGEWDIKAFAWCVIDLIKRDAKLERRQNFHHYAHQLKILEIDPSDNVLTDQRRYVLNLCNPSGPDILKAKALSKGGHHQESLNLYKKILSNGDRSESIETSFAWELYRVAKTMVEQNPPNFNGAKGYLNDYLGLTTEKPSLLHTCFLQLADKISKESQLKLGVFVRIWKLEYLRSEDYEPFITSDGKVLLSLAEKVVQQASKDAFDRNDQEGLQYILPFINKCIDRFPDNLWLKLRKAKTLMAMDRHNEALSFGLDVVKNKMNDYWAWELLGDIYQAVLPKTALSCYCKSLLCSKDINFVGKVKIKLAELLVKNKDYPQAKLEIEEVINYRVNKGQKIPEVVEILKCQSWYETEVAVFSNQEFYKKKSPMAEKLLYNDLPWVNGVVGEVFTTKTQPNKPKLRLHIESGTTPMETSIPASKFSINEKKLGMGIRIKGGCDIEGRFQIYALESRDATDKWDIFDECIGVVDHVNQKKNLLHFMVSRNIDGIIRFADLSDEFDEGDAIAVRISQYTSKQGVGYRVLTSRRTTMPISEDLVKPFESSVREENGMGFTDNDIFIPPPIIKKYNIKNDDYLTGKAILNYNKKRCEWGWKALIINSVDRHELESVQL